MAHYCAQYPRAPLESTHSATSPAALASFIQEPDDAADTHPHPQSGRVWPQTYPKPSQLRSVDIGTGLGAGAGVVAQRAERKVATTA
jgi:hypothetical protein